MIDVARYTSGRIAIANLSAMIDALERRRLRGAPFEELLMLSRLLFMRGDLLGRIRDHDRAESAAREAIFLTRDEAAAHFTRAQLSGRFHRFEEAKEFLERARRAGYQREEIEREQAALLQAIGKYAEALLLREKLAKVDPGIHSLGALASLLAEMGEQAEADDSYAAALEADCGVSPLPCAQLLFEWGLNAMRRGDLELAESRFAALDLILPAHVPGRGHRAEVALERRQLDRALALILPLIDVADDPEYRATYAQILAARGEHRAAAREAEQAAAAYDQLLARRPEAYADHAATFFLGLGNRPQRAVELAESNWKLRNTPRSRNLLFQAQRNAASSAGESARRIA
jgi:tetratricopeptide (TPR) repeat protein